MTIGTRHWMVAIGVAFGFHVAALLMLDLGRDPVVMGTGGGVRIALGDAVGPPAGEPAAPPPAPVAKPPTPSPRPVEAVKPPPQPRETPAVPKPAPAPPPPAPERSAEKPAETVPEAAAAAGPRRLESEDRLAAVAPGEPGPVATTRASERGLEGLDPAYVRRFLASLERQKQYPRAARTRGMEGTALLWVRLDRGGRVLAYQVEESSGHRVLDRAVLRAIERANPLPPLPESYPGEQLEVVIPIAFQLR